MQLAGGQIAKDLLYINLPCHTLLYFIRMVGVCSITFQPITLFSLFVRLERRENNPTRSTIWLIIWGLLNQNTRVLLYSCSRPRQQYNPTTHRFSCDLVSYCQTPTRRHTPDLTPGQHHPLGLPQASTALFPKQRAFQASKSQNLATGTISNPISDN